MKYVFLVMALLITDLDKISKINTLKSEAKEAYQKGDFQTAVDKYRYLRDSLGVQEEEVMMNLANAYFQLNDTTQAMSAYRNLSQASNANLRSVANQQLGVLANRKGQLEEALNYFKQSLKASPQNEEARYNYEMVKKKLDEQKKQQEKQNKDQQQDQKQQQDQQKKEEEQKKQDQQKQDQKNQEKKDQKDKQDQKDQKNEDQKSKEEKEKQEKEKQQQEQQEKESKEKDKLPPSVADKLKQMEMSEEKAKMILEAMKNQEIQYLQQNKRKATKPKDKGKPDW